MTRLLQLSFMLLLICQASKGQTFQSTNSLSQKERNQRNQIKEIDTLKRSDTDTGSLRLMPLTTLQNKVSTENLDQIKASALKAENSISGDPDIPKNVKYDVSNSIQSITDQTDSLKSEIIKLKNTIDASEQEAIKQRISKMEQELEVRQRNLEELKKTHKSALGENKKLNDQIKVMNNSLAGFREDMRKKDTALFNYAQIIYKLRLKLNEPDLEGIFRKYANVRKKFEEINTELDSITWFVQKNFSREDGLLVTKAHQELVDKFASVKLAKARQSTDSAAFSKALEAYRKLDIIFNGGLEIEPASLAKIFNDLDNELDKKYKAASASFKALESEINNYINDYKKTIALINPILAKYAEKEGKEQHYSVFGGFKKILEEQGAFIPEINVFANKQFGKETFGGYGQIRLFTGTGIANNNFNTKLNFFVPEASTFSIVTDLGLGFSVNTADGTPSKNAKNGMKDIGINTSFYLMGKSLNPTDSLTIKPNVGLWRTGLEILPFQNFFSLRINMNGLFTTNRIAEIKKQYVESYEHYWYSDVAFSALLDIKETKNWKLKFDLNLIFLNKKMKTFLETEDNLLPQVKVELVSIF